MVLTNSSDMPPLRKALTKGRGRVKQGADVRHVDGRDTVHAMHRGGHATMLERALEYRGPQPPAKRARADSPANSLDENTTAQDTPYIPGPDILIPDMVTLTSGSPLEMISGNPLVLAETSAAIPSASPAEVDPKNTQKDEDKGKEKEKHEKKHKKKVSSRSLQLDMKSDGHQKQSQAVKVSEWEPFEATILDALFTREYAPGIGEMCECGARPADARCTECGAMRPQCQPCIEKAHKHLHLHWIDVWNGDYFERKDLSALGHTIYLGHHDGPCPHIPTANTPVDTVIVHTNGVHRCCVHYCHCVNNRPHFNQLMTSGYWPSTLDSPQTAFTEVVMKDWHLHWDISHKSAQDYYRVKVRLTNNSNPGAVDVRASDCITYVGDTDHFAGSIP